MQKLSSLLKTRREELNISIERASEDTKIRRDFINLIEEGKFEKFPSLPHLRGFVQIYSKYLYLKEDIVMALFRRELNIPEQKDSSGEELTKGVFLLTQKKLVYLLTGISILFFLIYTGSEFKKLTDLPKFEIVSPAGASSDQKEVFFEKVGESVNILGTTNKGIAIYIDEQKINLNNLNQFKLEGYKSDKDITIKAVNQFGIESSLRLLPQKSESSTTSFLKEIGVEALEDTETTVIIDGVSILSRTLVKGSLIDKTTRADLNLSVKNKLEVTVDKDNSLVLHTETGKITLTKGRNIFEVINGVLTKK